MEGSEFSLRKATAEDIPQILAIENRVYPSPWSESNFQTEMVKPYSRFLVMTDEETDSVVAGYIIFWMLFDECQILNVAVSLDYRGEGLAKKMLRKAIDLSLKASLKRVVLDVRKSNLPAIHLYQEIGFTIAHYRKGYYSNGEDAYQMVLDLVGRRVEF